MSDRPIFVAVDTGGTRTNVDIHDPDDAGSRHTYELPFALSGSLTPSDYTSTLRRMLAGAESYWSMADFGSRPVFIFLSAAGFAPSVRDFFVDALQEVMPTALGGAIAAVGVANDAPALLLGHEADAIVIAGTGSNVLIRSKSGEFHQVGGHEWVVSDFGSGFWIGLRAVRRAYRDFEDGVDSVLLQRLIQLFGIRSNDRRRLIGKMRDLSIADENMKPEVARFAAAVCAAAERGDTAAQDVVKAEAEDLADVTAGAIRRWFSLEDMSGGLRLVQCGGLLTNDFYRSAFETQIEMRLRFGTPAPPHLTWERVSTGIEASLRLAKDLDSEREWHGIEGAFAPLILRFA